VAAEGREVRRSEIRGQQVRELKLYSAKDLNVYKKSYQLAMRIFEIRFFPDFWPLISDL